MKEKIFELLQEECYDILDAFKPDDVCSLIAKIVSRIKQNETDKHMGSVVTAQLGNYSFKVNNKLGGFVSCSDDENTGISSTLYYPYFEEDEDDYGLKNLIEMVNEAWYHCVN